MLQPGTDRQHVGEQPVEAKLCLHPTGERHCFAWRLCKGRQSRVRGEGPAATSLSGGASQGHGVPLLPPALPGCSPHSSPWPHPQRSVAAPVGQMGSVRERASFRVCLISITCFPVTTGSRPRSGGDILEAQVSLQVPYLPSCLSEPTSTYWSMLPGH